MDIYSVLSGQSKVQPERPQPKRGEERAEEAQEGEGQAQGVGDKGEAKSGEVRTSIVHQVRTELNMQIIQSASEVSLSSANEPLHLLYSAAIDKLNEVLKPELGDQAIQKAAEKPDDWTPEKVSERIVSFATGMFGLFKKQHQGEDEGAVLSKFMDTVGGGIEQGFKEARDVLDGLGVLQGDVKDGVDKTYSLVQEGLKKFREGIEGKSGEQQAAADQTSAEVLTAAGVTASK